MPARTSLKVPTLFVLVCSLLIGCGDDRNKVQPPKDKIADANTTSEGSDTANVEADATDANKVDMDSYGAVFVSGIDQNVITNRMESNFNLFFKTVDKSDLDHFPSAGMLIFKGEGLEEAKYFTGFERRGATLNILTNPFSMEQTTRNVIGDVMNDGRAGTVFTKTIEVDGYNGVFYASKERVGRLDLGTYTIAFGDDNFSWIVKATFQPEMEMEIGESLLKSVLNARVSQEPRLPPGEDVDFIVRSEKLKVVDGFIDKLVLTKDGSFPLNDPVQPIFQIAKGALPDDIKNRKEFASVFLSPSALFQIDMVSSQKDLKIAGLEGYEFVSLGKDRINGNSILFYSAVLFDEDGIYVMHGWVGNENAEGEIPVFRQLAESFRKKDGGKVTDEAPEEEAE